MAELDKDVGSATTDAENTQTRKTIKLKAPSAPIPASMTAGARPTSSGSDDPKDDNAGSGMMSDTQTRKTIKLKPPVIGTAKTPSDGGASPKGDTVDTGTQTRKVVMLKPTPARYTPVDPGSATGTAAKSAPADENNDETVKVKRVGAPAKPGAGIGPNVNAADKTVKLQPRSPAQATVAAPAKTPAVNPPRVAADAAAAHSDATAHAASENAVKSDANQDLSLKKDGKDKSVPPSALNQMADLGLNNSGRPSVRKQSSASPAYTVVSIITLLLLIVAAVVTSVQYLNTYESDRIGTEIKLPFLAPMQ